MNNRFCNNVVKTRGDERNEITYRFVTDGAGGVPARATVRIGDKDPLTFETVTEEFVKDYHRMEDREVYYNQKSTGMLHGYRTLSYDCGRLCCEYCWLCNQLDKGIISRPCLFQFRASHLRLKYSLASLFVRLLWLLSLTVFQYPHLSARFETIPMICQKNA